MPHLSEVQAHYRDKGLTVIGMTSADERGNTFERVKEMVADKGDTMAYTVAWDNGQETHEAYMTAARQGGIPCSFVVNGSGKIAYIGHPVWLDLVLEEVVAGTWDPAKADEVIGRAEEKLNAISQAAGSDPAKAIELVEVFGKEYPSLAGMLELLHFSLLLDLGRLDEGYALGREIATEAMKKKDVGNLVNIAGLIVDPDRSLERRDLELAAKAAKMANELTDGEDPRVLMTLARVHSLKGEHEEAIALQEKAISLAENDRVKEFLEGVLEELKAAAGQ
jgi:tetratricopeptide (TPR) repeat protein